jgi:hypothetical protein
MVSNMHKSSIKCLENDYFLKMKRATPNDCSETVKQQMETEDLVRSNYEEFLSNLVSDPE